MNTADFLLNKGSDDQIALITDTGEYTYFNLRSATCHIMREMKKKGVNPGQRVGLLGENSFFWIVSYLATLKLGAVCVPLPTSINRDTLHKLVEFIHFDGLCIDKRLWNRLEDEFREVSPRLILDDALSQPLWQGEEFERVLSSSGTDEHKDAALMLTSGTTSNPKVVNISHQNIQSNTESIIEYLNLTSDDRIMAILPFFYCFGTSLLHTHLRVGGSIVISNRFAYPETVLDLMERTRCTGFAGVPTTFQTLLRNSTFSKRKISFLKKVQQAGGKLSPILIKELHEAIPDAKIFIMYGQTEATARLSYLPPELIDSKIGSIGRGIPGVELRVVGDAGEEVKPGEIGEIIARGENIAVGYLDNPEATNEKFINGTLRTGDLATIDEDGFIYIVDRKSDFIKPYGYRVSSQQIEEYILELPDVVSAAVIGIPDLTSGEAVRAYVVLTSGSRTTSKDIISHCKRRMPRYMVPESVSILESLPLNENGKVIKSILREKATVSAKGK